MAVSEDGQVLVWGHGFKKELIHTPRLLFWDQNGVDDLKFGLNHGIYIQQNT